MVVWDQAAGEIARAQVSASRSRRAWFAWGVWFMSIRIWVLVQTKEPRQSTGVQQLQWGVGWVGVGRGAYAPRRV